MFPGSHPVETRTHTYPLLTLGEVMAGNGNGTSERRDTNPISRQELDEALHGPDLWSRERDDDGADEDWRIDDENEDDEQTIPTAPKSRTRRYFPFIILTGGVAFALSGMLYAFGEGFNYLWQAVVFAALWCAVTVWAILTGFKQEDERRVQNPPEEQHNVYKPAPDRDYWVLTAGESKVVYWSRRHWIDCVILVGNAFMLLAFSLWALTHFAGAYNLLEGDIHGNPATWIITSVIIGPGTVWSVYCTREPPIQTRQEKEEQQAGQPHIRKFGKWHLTIRPLYLWVLLSLPFITLWWWLRWPIVGWLVHRLIEDPYRLAWLGIIGFGGWTAARIAYYLGSFIGVTNREIWLGNTGYWIGGNNSTSMERDRLTNSAIRDTRFGRLVGFSKAKAEGEGQFDTEFHALRIPHREVFQQFLGRPQLEE